MADRSTKHKSTCYDSCDMPRDIYVRIAVNLHIRRTDVVGPADSNGPTGACSVDVYYDLTCMLLSTVY